MSGRRSAARPRWSGGVSEWELLLRSDMPRCYVVEAKPAGFPWSRLERTEPFWRLIRVRLLPVEIDWLLDPTPRMIGEDSARVRTLNRLVLPALPREGITIVSRSVFLAAVQ